MIEKAIDSLNDAFLRDPEAVRAVFAQPRVPCNEALADHPTVQVLFEKGETFVGIFGMLNGAIEPITGERIAGKYADNGDLIGFCKYVP